MEVNHTVESSSGSWQSALEWGGGTGHPSELSTCRNYFLSARQDVIKLKDAGPGQNNRERKR